jgi:hypothetical protein
MTKTDRADMEDIINGISSRLSVITDLCCLYESLEMNSGGSIGAKTFSGIQIIIDECIDKLEALKKQ